MTNLRLFVAVDVPAEIRTVLDTQLTPARSTLPAGRWSPVENWHITLKFLGSTPESRLPWVEERIALAARVRAPFRSRILGMGTFPTGRRRARVLWAGLDDPEDAFAGLSAALDASMAPEFEIERRSPTPHLTVARWDPPAQMPNEMPQVDSPAFVVDRLVLYRSHLRRPAPVYESLTAFPLGASDPG